MIYLFIFVLILFFSYKYDYLEKKGRPEYLKIRKQNERASYLLLLLILVLVSGFRYRIGVDTIRYEITFSRIQPIQNYSFGDLFSSSYEPLYFLLASVAKSISSEFWVLQLLQSLLVNTIIFRFIWKNINNIFTGVLIYYIFLFIPFTCEVMREACAVSMIILGWEFLKNDKWIPFTLFVILALGFHISALPLLVIPLLKVLGVWKRMRINSFTPVILIICCFAGYIVNRVFYDYIILFNITENLNSKATSYMEEAEGGIGLNLGGMLSKLFQYALFVYISIRHFKFTGRNVPNNLEPLLLLCLIFQFLSFSISMLYRYNNYFMPFTLICIADMFYDRRLVLAKKIKVAIAGFIIWFVIYSPAVFFNWYGLTESVHGTQYRNYMCYYPYSSIFTKEKNLDRERLFLLYDYDE